MNNNWKITKTLFLKEIRDVLRDKKTVMIMVLIPVVIYPLIMLVSLMVASMMYGNEDTVYDIVAYNDSSDFDTANLEKVLKENAVEMNEEDGSEEQLYKINYETTDEKISEEECKNKIKDKDFDVYLEISDSEGKADVKAFYMESENESQMAMNRVKTAIDDISDVIREKNVENAGLDANSILNPIAFEQNGLSSDEQIAGFLLGTILPMIIIISILLSVMYPCIDLTAGEKERGTLETLLMLPVSGKQIVTAKILTTSLCGVVTSILNILSMSIVFSVILEQQKALLGTDGTGVGVSSFISAMLVTLPVILVTALFLSAVIMCFTCFAKSYKEANNYLSPAMMLIMLMAYGSMIPSLELNQYTSVVPVLNVSLLIREALNFKLNYSMVIPVLCSMVLYSVFAIMFLSKAYSSENLLFGDGKNGISLFEKRSNIKKGMTVTIGDACFIFPFVLLMYLLFGGLLQVKYELAGMVLGQFLILAGIPLAFFIYSKKDLKKVYSFNKCNPLSPAVGVLIGVGGFLFAALVGNVISNMFGLTVSDALAKTFEKYFSQNVVLATVCIALTPAIAEEMFFRGVLFGALKDKLKPVFSVMIVSVLFGVFHMDVLKFFTTGSLGVILCLVLYYSGSIFPSMFAHFTINFISVIAGKYATEHFSEMITRPIFGIAGLAVVILGLMLIKYLNREVKEEISEESDEEKKSA